MNNKGTFGSNSAAKKNGRMESHLAPSAAAEYMVYEDRAKNDCAVPRKGLIYLVETEVIYFI